MRSYLDGAGLPPTLRALVEAWAAGVNARDLGNGGALLRTAMTAESALRRELALAPGTAFTLVVAVQATRRLARAAEQNAVTVRDARQDAEATLEAFLIELGRVRAKARGGAGPAD